MAFLLLNSEFQIYIRRIKRDLPLVQFNKWIVFYDIAFVRVIKKCVVVFHEISVAQAHSGNESSHPEQRRFGSR